MLINNISLLNDNYDNHDDNYNCKQILFRYIFVYNSFVSDHNMFKSKFSLGRKIKNNVKMFCPAKHVA